MNKKLSALFALTSLLLSSCATLTIPGGISHGEQGEGGETPEEVVFNVTSSKFIDEEGHLEVSYSCNYSSYFYYVTCMKLIFIYFFFHFIFFQKEPG